MSGSAKRAHLMMFDILCGSSDNIGSDRDISDALRILSDAVIMTTAIGRHPFPEGIE